MKHTHKVEKSKSCHFRLFGTFRDFSGLFRTFRLVVFLVTFPLFGTFRLFETFWDFSTFCFSGHFSTFGDFSTFRDFSRLLFFWSLFDFSRFCWSFSSRACAQPLAITAILKSYAFTTNMEQPAGFEVARFKRGRLRITSNLREARTFSHGCVPLHSIIVPES